MTQPRYSFNGRDDEGCESWASVVRTEVSVILTSRVRRVLPLDTPLGKLIEVATIASDEARSALYESIDDDSVSLDNEDLS